VFGAAILTESRKLTVRLSEAPDLVGRLASWSARVIRLATTLAAGILDTRIPNSKNRGVRGSRTI